MLAQADEVSEFVDALLPDHGRIHVGDQQFLAPARRRLNDDVDRIVRDRHLQPRAQVGKVMPRSRQERVNGKIGREPVARCVDQSSVVERARHCAFVERRAPSGDKGRDVADGL